MRLSFPVILEKDGLQYIEIALDNKHSGWVRISHPEFAEAIRMPLNVFRDDVIKRLKE